MLGLTVALVTAALVCAGEYFVRVEIRQARERQNLPAYSSFDPWGGVFSRDKTVAPQTTWAAELFRIINTLIRATETEAFSLQVRAASDKRRGTPDERITAR